MECPLEADSPRADTITDPMRFFVFSSGDIFYRLIIITPYTDDIQAPITILLFPATGDIYLPFMVVPHLFYVITVSIPVSQLPVASSVGLLLVQVSTSLDSNHIKTIFISVN